MSLENSFAFLEKPTRTQRFADKFIQLPWPKILQRWAHQINPLMRTILNPLYYYWSIRQCEVSTDIIFEDRAWFQAFYPKLLKHASLCFGAEDVMTFLGRKLTGQFAGEIVSELKHRLPGARIKHWMKNNWIKMYNKNGLVLRVETVINQPGEFKVRKRCVRKGRTRTEWVPMRKGVANLFRYYQVSQAANQRYFDALSVVENPAQPRQIMHRLANSIHHHHRSLRGFNPISKEDQKIFQNILRGEHLINGFRNRDIRLRLFAKNNSKLEQRRQSAQISRILKRLHVRGLIAKIPHSRRWRVTQLGNQTMSAAIHIYEELLPLELLKTAT